MPRDDRELVYSTEGHWEAPKARRAPKSGAIGKPQLPDDGVVRVARNRRRAGTMSVIAGLRADEIDAVAKALKRFCGTGGTAKNGVVEIQGDHRDKIVGWFVAQGRKAKVAGG